MVTSDAIRVYLRPARSDLRRAESNTNLHVLPSTVVVTAVLENSPYVKIS